eukprot:symbB.v1.2.013515.t1/scaffold795.1/size259473/7
MQNDFCLDLPRLLDERCAAPQRSETPARGAYVQLKKEMEDRLGKLQLEMQRKQDESEKTLSTLQSKNAELERVLLMQARTRSCQAHPQSQELQLNRAWWLRQRTQLMEELHPHGRC